MPRHFKFQLVAEKSGESGKLKNWKIEKLKNWKIGDVGNIGHKFPG